MNYNISRQEIYILLAAVKVPELIARLLAQEGIMYCAEPLDDESQEKIYTFNLNAFNEVPDEVIKGMYVDLRKFFVWYRLKKEHLPPEHQFDFDVVAKKFIERFICTWKKYEIV